MTGLPSGDRTDTGDFRSVGLLDLKGAKSVVVFLTFIKSESYEVFSDRSTNYGFGIIWRHTF